MNGYQWTVLLAAWLGWGFDVFDGLLFNYVAPNCVPTLLGIPLGTPAAKAAYQYWTGLLAAILLLTWAAGGILFGRVADRIGRTKTLLLTMLLYAVGNVLLRPRPEHGGPDPAAGSWRAWASAASGRRARPWWPKWSPKSGAWRRGRCSTRPPRSACSWRRSRTTRSRASGSSAARNSPGATSSPAACFAALVAFAVRAFVREPERWQSAAKAAAPPEIRELFRPENRAVTLSGLIPALIGLLTWWSCSTFIPNFATGLAQTAATTQHLAKAATQGLIERLEGAGDVQLQLGRPAGDAADHPRRPAIWAAGLCSASTFVLSAARAVPDVRPGPAPARRACPCTSSSA